MNQNHASAPQAAKTMLDMQATPAFNVCDRFGNGQGLEATMLAPAVYTSVASIRRDLQPKSASGKTNPICATRPLSLGD
jgi:hypothetical protein